MSVPENIRRDLRARLWAEADKLDWPRLPLATKSRHYEAWAKVEDIGGILSRYMALPKVRLYLKDSLLKDYVRSRSNDGTRPLQAAGVASDAVITERFIKPHGVRLEDGRVICWGRAPAWKTLLMAVHERCFDGHRVHPFAVVLTQVAGEYKQERVRRLVEDAAQKLGLQRVVWLEV